MVGQLHLDSYPQRQRPHDQWLTTCPSLAQASASWVPSPFVVDMVVAYSPFFSQWIDIREHVQETMAIAPNLYFGVRLIFP